MGEHIVLDVDRLNAVSSTAAAAAAESPFDKNASSSQATTMADAAQGGEQHMLLFYPSQGHHHHHHHHHRAIDLTRSAGAAVSPPLKEYQDRGNSMECIECRICQEEDETGNLEIPCACCGSLKYAHRKCVQRWCNEKGDTMCEICQQPFKSGYTSPVRPVQPAAGVPNDLGSEWGHQLDFRDPRFLAMAERHLMQEYDEYAAANASGAACCRSAALVLMALLLLRHTLAIGTTGSDEDASTFFTLFFLRAAGFLLPCYIMARAMNIIQRRRQRQEWSSTRSFSMLDASPPHRVPFLNLLTSRV